MKMVQKIKKKSSDNLHSLFLLMMEMTKKGEAILQLHRNKKGLNNS